MRATASAPGKVVILGEYAVLEGAPALVMAVDRRVRVSLHAHGGPHCTVSAPGLTDSRGRFELAPCGPRWLEGDAETFRLATHIIAAFFGIDRDATSCGPFDLVLDSAALMERGAGESRKLGLGSSAALTVALYHALGYYVATQHEQVATPDLERLIHIHAGLQGRRGSGLDVAASLYGGLIEYNRSPTPHAIAASLPEDVGYCFVWSGREALTGRFLAAVDAWRRDNEPAYRGILNSLSGIAHAGAAAAHGNDADTFLETVEEYVAGLQALGRASGTDILSAPHRRLRSLARDCGVVYKPCGAGGGDIGVGMSRDPGALARFRDAVVAGNFQLLALNSEREGVEARSGN